MIDTSIENRRRLSGPGLRTFLGIADEWGLSEAERRRILGTPDRPVYEDWIACAQAREELELSDDTLTRISAVLGIHKDLHVLCDTDAEEVDWLKGPHDAPTFGGKPPLDLVTRGDLDGLMTVHRYLDGLVGEPPAPERIASARELTKDVRVSDDEIPMT